MSAKEIMAAIVTKVKAVLAEAEGVLDGELTPQRAEEVSRVLRETASAAWVEGFRTWLEGHQTDAPTVEVDGETYRYKLDSEKEFLTPGGRMLLNRRIYQRDEGGPCYIPLDAAWGMEGQSATIEVRDAVLFSVALSTPRETETLLKKCSLFHPSETAIKTLAREMGEWLEEHEDGVLAEIRQEEVLPEETRVVCASLDGANVLLAERGKKRGRPAERPVSGGEAEEGPTCYKNAMVGSISLYGEVPKGAASPERLVSRYAARMPEDRAPTLKRKFEEELRALDERLDEEVVRIMLNDGARGLWEYVDQRPLYDGYERLVDYHHTTEHLSKAAESLFGKGSKEGQRWYERYAEVLKEEDGGAQRVIRSLDYYGGTRKLSQSRREALRVERTFFVNNQHRMEYARFRRHGWPIGSGPVEAACKSVVKTRLCRSGMRWSRTGGQHILTLRTYVKSGRWDAMWKQYKRVQRDKRAQRDSAPCLAT
jgi:hypothetical protein